ncbi:hypothetical protein AGABI1DRAFT_125014 [Agaricus bisporus var. burnettii JB137-S8]|uniref:Transmembrane protein n=1 Tax=Agaricus bisporus var. burnettii (strain JB137-S8 / ATCC MYA-4627 / FGSC 10392) TaxID=597362 RepID=K5X3Z1_AGABU|nr:uncharacterized protein AGABI1DRAFT_125014 [Agaricus bisporus var. burnettii JB137-S8]EKM82551.1 hypothetical protein AGABI1DRAFT_125014 [Agaricus bisporus var. burnettii JB137-S8]
MANFFFACFLAAFLPVALCQTISEAICDDESLDWSFNSVGATPCDVAADLAGVCNGGVFTLASLDEGFSYIGPTQLNQNSCRCSTVYYSLLSACAACQGEQWINWTIYKANCSAVYPSVFPQHIPVGTIVPGWAYADIRATDNTFNITVAQGLEDRPESTGIASSTRTRGLDSSTSTGTGFPSPSVVDSSGSSSNAGAIAGGVVGGVAGLALIAGLVFFYLRHRRAAAQQPAYFATPRQPPLDDTMEQKMTQNAYGPSPIPPFQPQRLYDPSDPSTFPTPSPAMSPSYNSGPYTPSPGSVTFQSSATHVPQHSIPSMSMASPHPAGNYSGAPEL